MQGLLIISGAFFITIYQAGWALTEIGSWSLVVWAVAVVVGLAQTHMLYHLAKAFPEKVGGTAVYALELFQGPTRVLGFLSGWGYWLAWAPATVLNSYLCALLINNILGNSISPSFLALGIMALLYSLNWFGLGRVLLSSYLLAFLVFTSLGILVWLTFQTVTPQKLALTLNFSQTIDWVTFLKWFFVIAWTAYGLEMISSVVAETKGRQIKPMFSWAAIWSVLAFVGIPFLLALQTDWKALYSDPFTSLRPLFEMHLGQTGATILALFLVAALLYSALAILVPSTRTIYQMSRDGLLPPYFATVNRYGTPQGSLVLDIILNVGLLLIFGSSLISIVAVANVGYMVVFVLLPIAYFVFLHKSGLVSPLKWSQAGVLLLLNLMVLLIGGATWGSIVFGIGCLLVGLGVPLYYLGHRSTSQAQDQLQ